MLYSLLFPSFTNLYCNIHIAIYYKYLTKLTQ
ncbi:MAG: protein of unknown function DUF4317 [Podoviridae sp. cty5g4]|nr:MAG: protein of unknown function DUF4317 [Podoviridae sp. cty5g4]